MTPPHRTRGPDDETLAIAGEARAILEALAAARQTVTYKELGAQLVPPVHERSPRLHEALCVVSEERERSGLGLLSVLVVRGDSRLPGTRFFEFAAQIRGPIKNQRAFFDQEVEVVFSRYS